MALVSSKMLELGTALPNFSLRDPATGERVTDSVVPANCKGILVAVICNHCPYVVHIRAELAKLGRDVRSQVFMFAVSASDVKAYPADAPEQMVVAKNEYGYEFPYLWDDTQEFMKSLRAVCTPEFYLFDGERRLVYRGQFDASRPGSDVPPTGRDVRVAITDMLAGKPVDERQTPSIGCSIKWLPNNSPDYTNK